MENPMLLKASRLYEEKKWDEAEKLLLECRRRFPSDTQVYNLLGLVRLQRKDLPAALEAFRAGMNVDAKSPELWHNMGLVLHEQKQWAMVEKCMRAALSLAPDQTASQLILARCLLLQAKIKEAIETIEPLAAECADNFEFYFIRGTCFLRHNRLIEAEAMMRRALELRPGLIEGLNNLGVILRLLGRIEEADAIFKQVLEIDPRQPDAHINRATIKLLRGDMEAGWKEFEWRFLAHRLFPGIQDLTMPMWNGEPLPNGTIILLAEQGQGDTIQFIRLAKFVKERVGTVIVECQATLARLLRGVEGVDQIIIRDQPRPPFETYSGIMSLAQFFCKTLDSIPAQVPYLGREVMAENVRVRAPGAPLRVGLVWAGSNSHAENASRSLPLKKLLALQQVPGVELISLQKLEHPAPGETIPFVDGVGKCRDFLDTAKVIAGLDLVISVDTAVAHLTGALGKPVWILLRDPGEWRWLLDRSTTPWYPTARLFRQPAMDDWDGLIAIVARELEETAKTGAGLLPSA